MPSAPGVTPDDASFDKRELTFVRQDGSRAFYSVRSTPEATGSFDMAIRVFPKNDKLPHRMDFALVKWA